MEDELETTQIAADLLSVGEDCFSFGLIGNVPMTRVLHRLLEIIPYIA